MSTKLEPMTEHLFQAWARAHGVQDHDKPTNSFDYRGLYQQSQGRIFPGHAIRQMAADHNAAANAKEGPATQSPDPFAAAAQMHGDKIKAQTDHAKETNKILLEREKMKHKLMIEHMKLQHKTQESDKDRQHQSQQAVVGHQLDRQAAVQDAGIQQQQGQIQHQQALQQTQVQHQHDMQQGQIQRAQDVQDAQTQRAQAVQDNHQKNHFEMQKASIKATPLESQLMQRHAGSNASR